MEDVVQMLKLTSGETIIGKVEFLEDCYLIHDPMKLETIETGYVLNRYNPLSKDFTIIIPNYHVIFIDHIHDKMNEYYTLSVLYAQERLDKGTYKSIENGVKYMKNFTPSTKTETSNIQDIFLMDKIDLNTK